MVQFMASLGPIGRAMSLPPGVPEDRAKALRQAFTETLADPEFNRDAAKRGLPVNPVAASEVSKMVKTIVETPTDLIDQLKKAINWQS